MWWRRLRAQEGFSIAEIMVASIIVILAIFPIMNMFDGSITGIKVMARTYTTVQCAQTAMEEIKSMPFYTPYNPENGDTDIDDHFWGTRDPESYNPYVLENPSDPNSTRIPDWSNIPNIIFYDYGQMPHYESYQVSVQLSYLTDSVGVATMLGPTTTPPSPGWGPKRIGNDRPKNSDNTDIHLLLIRVNVYWLEDGNTKLYSIDSIKTDSEAAYPAGIRSVTVTGPPQVLGSAPNAVAHYPNVNANLVIDGFGFAPDAEAYIVRDPYSDIPITLTSRSATQLVGYVNLYQKPVGKWTIKVHQEQIVSLYLYNQFIIEYPRPVISNFYDKAGGPGVHKATNTKPFTVVISGKYFIKTPTVRLIQVVESNPQVINGTITTGNYPNDGYSESDCSMEVEFNPVGMPTGDYKLDIVNKDPTQIGAGHVHTLSTDVFTIQTVSPTPTDVMVNASGAHKAYKDRANPWRLRITGYDFNTVGSPPVDVYLCTEGGASGPGGSWVQSSNLVLVTDTIIIADFDLSSLPEGYYKAFVRNRNDGKTGYTLSNPLTVKGFAGGISAIADTDSSKDFWENYYDISSQIQGSDLANASQVVLTDGVSTDYVITSDCSGVGTDDGDTAIPMKLNLIDCSNTKSWWIRVYYPWGEYVEKDFSVALGPAIILPQESGAIRIYTWRGTTSYTNTETATALAWALRSTTTQTAYADFTVYGMGFPLGGNYTYLRVYRTTSPSFDYSGTYAVYTDRAGKKVWIETDDDAVNWSMPRTTSHIYCNIEVKATTGSRQELYTQTNRWYVHGSN
jgi:hypothetical protein